MASIQFTRSETNIPFTEKLKEVGAPIEHLLKKAKLPIHYYDERAGIYLPNHLVYNYRTLAAQHTSIEDLGFLVGKNLWRIQGASADFVLPLRQLSTLKLALEHLCKRIKKEAAGCRIWLISEGEDKVWCAWRRGLVPGFPVCHQSALYLFSAMVELICSWTGRDWYPERVFMPANLAFSPRQKKVFRNAQYVPTRDTEGFCFPRSFLALSPVTSHRKSQTAHSSISGAPSESLLEEGLIDQLRQVLQVYLADGYPHIELGAAIAGCSVRTLQRRLAKHHLCYSTLVEQARFQVANKALAESDIPLIELALDLGYSSQANFTRAFHRIAGITPSRYRRQQQFSQARRH